MDIPPQRKPMKLTPKQKHQAVLKHLSTGQSYVQSAQAIGIHPKHFRRWVIAYQLHGSEAYFLRTQQPSYSLEFKLQIIHLLEQGHTSAHLSLQYKLSCHKQAQKWQKAYQLHGIQGLMGHQKTKTPPTKNHQPPPYEALQKDSYQALLEELAYLRAENDYLKKLDAFIQAQENDSPKPKSSKN